MTNQIHIFHLQKLVNELYKQQEQETQSTMLEIVEVRKTFFVAMYISLIFGHLSLRPSAHPFERAGSVIVSFLIMQYIVSPWLLRTTSELINKISLCLALWKDNLKSSEINRCLTQVYISEQKFESLKHSITLMKPCSELLLIKRFKLLHSPLANKVFNILLIVLLIGRLGLEFFTKNDTSIWFTFFFIIFIFWIWRLRNAALKLF